MKKVESEGATQANIMALRELLRAIKGQMAAELGVKVDMSDPKIKAAHEQMNQEIAAATDEYTKTMAGLEAQAERLASDIQADLKHIERVVIQSAQAEA